MSREIKFRGKSRNGITYYGYLTVDAYGAPHIESLGETNLYSNRVIPDSIGQITGLKDADGNYIYEGKNSVLLTIIGLGEGLSDVEMKDGQWKLCNKSQGDASLFDLLQNPSIKITCNKY